jgi:RNA polymerase sigma-70 factor (ECF subfamily)
MTDDQNPSLDQLVAQLAEGDRAAFTAVFRALWTPTLKLCSGMLKNEADAADAAQQAMQKVLERASDYDPRRPALPWALAIAAWECRTILRKRSRRKEVSDEGTPEAANDDASAELEQRLLVQNALVAVGELSESDRETLVATFWDQAGDVGGATLRKRRERAVKRLRDAFRRLYGIA